MKITTTSYLRILKSSWGIYCKIIASSEMISAEKEITDSIIFENNLNNITLSDTERKFLAAGIDWVRLKISEKISYPVKISLNDIEFNYCDYQKQAIFYAIAHWASEHFNFDLPVYTVTFDKENNKYRFPDLNLRDN